MKGNLIWLAAGPTVYAAEPLPVALSTAGPPVLGSASAAEPVPLSMAGPPVLVSAPTAEPLPVALSTAGPPVTAPAAETLMDLKGLRLNNLSGFYGGLFKVWGLLRKERPECCGSLFWLLREPVVRGSRFVCGVGPSLQQRLCEERILTLGQVVEVCGPRLAPAAGLASRLSLRSVRVVSLLLQSWKQQLSQSELALIAAHCNGLKSPNDNDSFPEMRCFPDLSCEGFLLKLDNVSDFKFSTMSNKTFYYLVTKVVNQSRLQERVDTRWRARPEGGSEA
ncbi:putative 149 kDa protein [Dissostichus eleginoides]|uniref:149 kDa protein n=1 Tax=Dissostichus eleginoides TaxID=100907 RepID=A0AAD9CFE8_DISEL|nr:putative 149 kDa protein [Dissostichus eleginoides]